MQCDERVIIPFNASGLVGLVWVRRWFSLAPGRALGAFTFLPRSWSGSRHVCGVCFASWYYTPSSRSGRCALLLWRVPWCTWERSIPLRCTWELPVPAEGGQASSVPMLPMGSLAGSSERGLRRIRHCIAAQQQPGVREKENRAHACLPHASPNSKPCDGYPNALSSPCRATLAYSTGDR